MFADSLIEYFLHRECPRMTIENVSEKNLHNEIQLRLTMFVTNFPASGVLA